MLLGISPELILNRGGEQKGEGFRRVEASGFCSTQPPSLAPARPRLPDGGGQAPAGARAPRGDPIDPPVAAIRYGAHHVLASGFGIRRAPGGGGMGHGAWFSARGKRRWRWGAEGVEGGNWAVRFRIPRQKFKR